MIPASRVWKTMAGYFQVFSYVDCPPPTHVVRLLRKFLTPSPVKPLSSVTRSPDRTGEFTVRWQREPSAAEKSDMYVSWCRYLNSVLFMWYGKICCSRNDQCWTQRDTLLVLKMRSSPTTSTRVSSTNGTPTLFWATKINHYLKISSFLTHWFITTNEKSAT
jgi:hypothetical protein